MCTATFVLKQGKAQAPTMTDLVVLLLLELAMPSLTCFPQRSSQMTSVIVQASFSKSAGPTEVDFLEKASREQELEKQLHANLEEDNCLFTQFCDEAKNQVGNVDLAMHDRCGVSCRWFR